METFIFCISHFSLQCLPNRKHFMNHSFPLQVSHSDLTPSLAQLRHMLSANTGKGIIINSGKSHAFFDLSLQN